MSDKLVLTLYMEVNGPTTQDVKNYLFRCFDVERYVAREVDLVGIQIVEETFKESK